MLVSKVAVSMDHEIVDGIGPPSGKADLAAVVKRSR